MTRQTKEFGGWKGSIVTGLLGHVQDVGRFVDAHAERRVWQEQGAPGKGRRPPPPPPPSASAPPAALPWRRRLRRFHVARGLLDKGVVREVRRACSQLACDTEADSVDGVPAYYGALMSHGTVGGGEAAQTIMRLLAPAIEERILPLVRDAHHKPGLVLCEAFVRQYGGDDGVRVSIPPHYDSLSYATAVIGISPPGQYRGGLYLQVRALPAGACLYLQVRALPARPLPFHRIASDLTCARCRQARMPRAGGWWSSMRATSSSTRST